MTEPHLLRLGRWVAELDHATLPEDVRRAARYQTLDTIAAAHAGARSPETRSVVRGARALGGEGRSTVLATGEHRAPADAALVNAACSMTHDFDDIVWMGHTGHSAVFASLAVAEHEQLGGEPLVNAIVAANEIGGRIGASTILGPLNGQMWTFIHLVTAATATAKLLELDAERTAHALAIALAQPNFALQPAFMAPTSKLLSAATPTVTGIQSAYFAREGMTGALDILEDRRGFWHRFAYLPLPMMLGDLGELWTMRTLSFKTFPGCHYFQTACTALERILERTGPLSPEDVRSVAVDTTKLGCEATKFAGEYAEGGGRIGPVNANFDLATTAAIFLHARGLEPRHMDPAWLEAEAAAIRKWRARITVRHDPALTGRVIAATRRVGAGKAALASLHPRDVPRLARRYREEYGSTLFSPREVAGWARWLARAAAGRSDADGAAADTTPSLPFPNRVTVQLAGGRREVERVDLPAGSMSLPDVERELERKVLREIGRGAGEARARAAFEAGLRLESAEPAEVLAPLGS